MMEAEMEDHLGYEKSERSDNDDYRNSYKSKTVKSSIGEVELQVPQDRKSTFEPQVRFFYTFFSSPTTNSFEYNIYFTLKTYCLVIKILCSLHL